MSIITTNTSIIYHGENHPIMGMTETISPENTSLLDIFPVAKVPLQPSEILINLKKYLSFLMMAQEALDKFEKRIMHFFDPLVGENACQVRAAMFAEMINKEGMDEHLISTQKHLADHADKMKDLLAHLNIKSLNVDTFKSFLEKNNAFIEISVEISVIISSFILSETRIVEYKPVDFGIPCRYESNPHKIFAKRKGLSLGFAFDIIKIAQAKLSEFSVNYVQRLALQLPLSQEERTASRQVFGDFVKIDERQRKFTAFFPTLGLILKELHRSGIPVILKVKQYVKGQSHPYGMVSLVFGNQGKDDYCSLTPYEGLCKKGAMFIHTISITERGQSAKELEEKILRHNITDLILSAAADHPAYGFDKKLRPEDPLCDKYRDLAHEWGTCRSNPSLFMVEHICYDVIEIDSKGSIVESVYISIKQKVQQLFDTIADIGNFIEPLLGLRWIVKNPGSVTIENLMDDDNLKNDATIYACERRYTPEGRIYRKFKVKIF